MCDGEEVPKANLNVPVSSKSPKCSDRMADLKKQRATIRQRITMFQKYMAKFQDKAIISDIERSEVQLRVSVSESLFKNFDFIQTSIENEQETEISYRESFEELYFSAMAVAKCRLVVEESETDSKCTHSSKLVSVKLPEIKLPTFTGSYDQWLEYRDSYLSMIHKRDDLNAIQKFHYLRSSLSGCALQVIGALEFTASNYTHAWDLLVGRFHNNRLLTHNHVKSLFTIQTISPDSATQIRKLIDTVNRNLRALKTIGEPTDSWDTLIIYLVSTKLDSATEKEWENHKGSLASRSEGSFKLTDLLSFLKNRADMLEMISVNHIKSTNVAKPRPQHESEPFRSDSKKHLFKSKQNVQQVHSYVGTRKPNDKPARVCTLCHNNHALYTCILFLNLSVRERIEFIEKNKLCPNCLRSGHSISECTFGACRQCQEKHNGLLHIPSSEGRSNIERAHDSQPIAPIPQSVSAALHSQFDINSCENRCDDGLQAMSRGLQPVILSTAIIEIADAHSNYHRARALLDSGSQHCFITERLSKQLEIPIIQSAIRVSGVGQSVTSSSEICKIALRSKTCDYDTQVQCLILPCITSSLPSVGIDIDTLGIPSDVTLADPSFHIPSDIDVLLGADIFWELLGGEKIRLPSGPYLLSSKLGWVLSGSIYKVTLPRQVHCNFTKTYDNLDLQMQKFWELEEVPKAKSALSLDEQKCEDIFVTTTVRDHEGRFHVRIPLKESPESLGDSYKAAETRFRSLERKLERSPQYKKLYCDFIHEYLDLGHMSLIETYEKPCYFLPHHGVFRENSSTTKLRVVFDASAATSSNKSLNDIQYTGPILQNDIFSILLRFRQYKYVACADVEKMFRQILVQSDQRNLQLIIWRDNPSDPLSIYRLNTVSFGTCSAPYLSMRCLKELARCCDDPVVAKIIDEDFYVDDLLTGSDDVHTLFDICERISRVLRAGCLPLRKWTFNHDVTSNESKELSVGDLQQNKTLGLGWHTNTDELHYTSRIEPTPHLTKRVMLSVISQIYDPLGLLGPAVIVAKILMQKLWLCKLEWDETVPDDVIRAWSSFVETLQCLSELRVPRFVRGMHTQHTELHIFSDASQDAYGACAYIKTYDDNSPVTVRLLCAKGKVAPLKAVSIPRLELCGALVGARLYHKIKGALRLEINQVYFWTDSTIVIGWLRMSPRLLKQFVQNRVTTINELTGDSVWRHVSGKENPADLLSRGLNLNALCNSSLWFSGPQYLSEPHSFLPQTCPLIDSSSLPELKTEPQSVALVCHKQDQSENKHSIDFSVYSSLNRMKRIFAYVLRFTANCRLRRRAIHSMKTGPLSVDELRAAERVLVICSQKQMFPDEYYQLERKIPIKTNSKITGLNIFMDSERVIRVGGRLAESEFSYSKKHPVLLCSKHRFTELLFRDEHKRLLHAGPQLLLCTVRECWWPLGGRTLARQIVRLCVTCARVKGANTLNPIMGNLPAERLHPGYPFMVCGVDYGGPISILNRKGRGGTLSKGYICLFVCFVTRAVHLELVSGLSTKDYILALKRFISRRGNPIEIHSDNGRNFVGAERELSSFFKNKSNEILEIAANENIKLRFLVPYSPHTGGLWESGIKSCKHHLRRIMGNARLTFEEFSTVLIQIEAVLNSRPMSPLSSNPSDLSPLCPAHFLIGRPMTAPPCTDLTDAAPHRLLRYDRVEQMRQHFWRRWSTEYVTELQARTKWKSSGQDLSPEMLVLVKEDNLPPLRWRLGRVIKTYPGKDGVSRVADVRVANGIIRRTFAKLCPLPTEPPVAPDVASLEKTMLEADVPRPAGC